MRARERRAAIVADERLITACAGASSVTPGAMSPWNEQLAVPLIATPMPT